MKNKFLLPILFLLSIGTNAQVTFDKRIEKEITKKTTGNIVFYGDDYFLHYSMEYSKKEEYLWELDLYDKDLNVIGSRQLKLPSGYRLIGSDYSEGDVFVMFALTGFYDIQDSDHKLYVINCKSGKSRLMHFQLPELELNERLNYSDFFIDDNKLIMNMFLYSGMGFKGNSALYIYDFSTRTGTIMRVENELLGTKRNRVENVAINKDKQHYIVDVHGITSSPDPEYFTVIFDQKGSVVDHYRTSDHAETFNGIVTGSATMYLEDGTYFNIAPYITLGKKTRKKLKIIGPVEEKSEGIIFSKTDGKDTIFSTRVNYIETGSIHKLPNLRVNVPREGINNQPERVILLTKEILYHDPIILDDRTYFIGEVYGNINRVSSEGVVSIIGYRSLGAMIFCFSEEGELIWDNIVDMNVRQDKLDKQAIVEVNTKGNLTLRHTTLGHTTYIEYSKDGELLTKDVYIIKDRELSTASIVDNPIYIKLFGKSNLIVFGDEEKNTGEGKHLFFYLENYSF